MHFLPKAVAASVIVVLTSATALAGGGCNCSQPVAERAPVKITGSGWMMTRGFKSCDHILVSDCLPYHAKGNRQEIQKCESRRDTCASTGCWHTDTKGYICFRR